MKPTTTRTLGLALLPAAFIALASCSSTPEPPPPVGSAVLTYRKGVPGGVLLQTVKVTVTVAAIDPGKRKATLLASDGKEFRVGIARDAVNFDQVRVGDSVDVTLTEKLVISPGEKATPSGPGGAAVEPPGPSRDRAGGPAAEAIQKTATVVGIDPGEHKVTLQFEGGITQTITRTDVDMTRHKLGDKVVYRVIETAVIWIESRR